MIAIIDYGLGNVGSIRNMLKVIGEKSVITCNKEEIASADKIILPGVGAFDAGMKNLNERGLCDFLKKEASAGKPMLGICLGMQLLFERSFEYGEKRGLGLLKGEVRPLGEIAPSLKIPHMGWNSLRFTKKDELFKYNREGDYVYFVHSYYAAGCEDSLVAYAEYGGKVTAAVRRANVFGTQFHPEKSGAAGLKILKAFSEVK